MYKYFEKGGYHVMYYRFDSIYEFVDYLINAPRNKDFYKEASITGDYSFCKTRSLDEALNLIKYGYHENFEKLVQLKLDIEKYVKIASKRNKQYNFYVGYAPDVKAYLEGSPLSMLNKMGNIRKKIDLYINTSYSSGTSTGAIFNRGAIVLALIEILESLGFSVDFHIFEMSTHGNQMHFSDFILKKENERLNPQKLYFPLCHPSWVRRLNFRLLEKTPDITSGWTDGYGTPSTLDTMKRVVDLKSNDIVIPTVQELDIGGRDIIADTNSLFRYINNLTDKDFKLEEVQKVKRL